MRTDRIITSLLLLIFLSVPVLATAGSLDAAGTPAVGSGMPTTTDIFNRLDTGAASSVPSSFQEPATGPTSGSGKSLIDIQGKLPVPDNTNGATASEVTVGKTFWGLRTDGTWGVTSGSMPPVANLTEYTIQPGKTVGGITGKRWQNLGNGTVQDMKTDLVWQQTDDDVTRTYDAAVAYCSGLVLSGNRWRLPERAELRYLTRGVESVRSSSPRQFSGVNDDRYWSSTTYAYSTGSAWSVYFVHGSDGSSRKTNGYYVRCVR